MTSPIQILSHSATLPLPHGENGIHIVFPHTLVFPRASSVSFQPLVVQSLGHILRVLEGSFPRDKIHLDHQFVVDGISSGSPRNHHHGGPVASLSHTHHTMTRTLKSGCCLPHHYPQIHIKQF